jgi:hypothetical protein
MYLHYPTSKYAYKNKDKIPNKYEYLILGTICSEWKVTMTLIATETNTQGTSRN